MARLTGPLFALAASGTIAETLTYARWKGIQYVRTRVIPLNPQSLGQQEVRGVFATLTQMYKRMPAGARLPWEYAVRGLPLTARNRHIQANVAALQGQANLDALVMSVASGSAVLPDNVVTGDGADGTITVTADAPAAPPGYTFGGVSGAAVLDGDPSPAIVRTTYFMSDGIPPFSFAIDVPTDDDYQVGVWCGWIRDSDGQLFISEADRTQVAVTGN